MISLLGKSQEPRGIFYHIFHPQTSLNNIDKIQRHLDVALKVILKVGMVFSAMAGFYSFQYITTSVHLMEYWLAMGAFLTSVVSFASFAKYSYFHRTL